MVLNLQARILNASTGALLKICSRNQDNDVIYHELDADHTKGTPEGTQGAFGSGFRLGCWAL